MCANFLGAHSRNTQSALTIAQQEISKLSVFGLNASATQRGKIITCSERKESSEGVLFYAYNKSFITFKSH